MEQLVLFAIPIFTLLMAVEFAYGWFKNKNTYDWEDTFSNLIQGLISRLSQFVNQFFHIGIYTLVYNMVWGDFQNPFWSTWTGIALGLMAFDFCDYWFHRTEHKSAILWASHVIHHQSKRYNLSVALRQVSTEPILGFVFYLPLAFIGMPPKQLLVTVLIVLFYQFWVHTEHIGKMGWFDLIFNSPANHRVHHAINPKYVDKNYGGFLMIWDHIFGTYEPEVEACVYGTLAPFDSVDPVWTVLFGYVSVYKSVRQTADWSDKLKKVFMPPGWSADPRARTEHLAAQEFAAARKNGAQASQILWSRNKVISCLLQFFSIVFVTVLFLSFEDEVVYTVALQIIGSIVFMCWGLGAVMNGKINYFHLLLIDALSTCVIAFKFMPYLV